MYPLHTEVVDQSSANNNIHKHRRIMPAVSGIGRDGQFAIIIADISESGAILETEIETVAGVTSWVAKVESVAMALNYAVGTTRTLHLLLDPTLAETFAVHLPKWREAGWRKSRGEAVDNVHLWREIAQLKERFDVATCCGSDVWNFEERVSLASLKSSANDFLRRRQPTVRPRRTCPATAQKGGRRG